MIRLLLLLTVGVLLFIGWILLKKQHIFFTLIKKNETNQNFLALFGRTYCFLAIIGVLAIGLNERFFSILFIFFILIVAGLFSVFFSQKIEQIK